MGQRARQPALRQHRDQSGRGAHLEREQPREPADAVRERSGHRSDRRGDLPARRGRAARCGRDPGAAAADAALAALGGAPRARASRASRAPRAASSRSWRLRRARRTGEAVAPDAHQPLRSAPAPRPLRLQRVAARPAARGRPAFVATEHDAAERRAARAQPLQRPGLRERVAFAAASEPLALRHRRPAGVPRPQRLARSAPRRSAAPALANRFGAGLDPCAALQVAIDARARRDARTCVFLLGQGRRRGAGARARAALRRRRRGRRGGRARAGRGVLGRDRSAPCASTTPDDSFDLLVNRWLLYQDLACRLWARSGFYQSGGAYGFRDQLQDVLALALHAAGPRARAPAARGARASSSRATCSTGGIAPGGRGIRTRCSDDLLWLPYAIAAATSRPPATARCSTSACPSWKRRRSRRGRARGATACPAVSTETGTLFEHCAARRSSAR